MGGASFWGGLLQGFSGPMLQKEEEDRQQKRDVQNAKIKILSQIDPSKLDPVGLEEWKKMIDDPSVFGGPAKGGKGGKKPSDMLGRIVEHIKELKGKGGGGGESKGGGQPMDEKIPGTNSQYPGAPGGPGAGQKTAGGDVAGNGMVPQGGQQAKPIAAQVSEPPKPPSIGDILSHQKDPFVEYQKEERFATDERIRLYNETKAKEPGGAYTGKSTATGSMLPKDSVDSEGSPIDPKRRYKVAENKRGEEKYFPIEEPKKTAAQMKLAERVKNRMEAKGEDEQTATRAVRRADFEKESNDFLSRALRNTGQRLSNEKQREQIAKIKKELDNSEGLSQKTAKILMAEAQKTARERHADKMGDDWSKSIPALISEELAKLGVTYDEVAEGLRSESKGAGKAGGGASSGRGVKPPPSPPSGGGDNPLGLDLPQ